MTCSKCGKEAEKVAPDCECKAPIVVEMKATAQGHGRLQ